MLLLALLFYKSSDVNKSVGVLSIFFFVVQYYDKIYDIEANTEKSVKFFKYFE